MRVRFTRMATSVYPIHATAASRCGLQSTSARVALCLALSALAQSPVWSADAAADSDVAALEEVVVTARYRSEDLQQTPIAITALSRAQIEAHGYDNVLDITSSAPNVSISPATVENGKSAQVFVRGVGQVDVSAAFSPGVGFEIDGVYFDSVFGSQLALMDLERIEVLRGPQGTLFGKNTNGGIIRLVSERPKGDGTGYLEASYGTYDRRAIRGAFDVSVIPDQLFLRVAGAQRSVDGYMDILDYACVNPSTAGSLRATTLSRDCKTGELGGSDVTDFRVSLRALPVEGLELNLIAHYLKDTGDMQANKTLMIVDDPANGAGAQLDPLNKGPNGVIATYGIPIDSRFVTPSPYTTYQGFCSYVSGLCTPNRSGVEEHGLTGLVDWDLTDIWHLHSVTGYEEYDGEFASVVSGAPIPQQGLRNLQQHHQFSQELDLTGALQVGGRALDLTTGLYYLDSETRLQGLVDIPVVFSFTQDDPTKTVNKSAFLHSVYHLTDALSVEVGYRFSRETRTIGYNHVMVYPAAGIPVFVNPGRDFSYSRGDWKLGISEQLTPGSLVYASAASGFKGGGINPRPILPNQITTFTPEKLISYELGLKTQMLERRLQANLAVFQSDYEDLQTALQGSDAQGAPLSTVANSDARIRGAELEILARPVGALSFDASVGYVDFKYSDLGTLTQAFPLVPITATQRNVPKWTVSTGVQYRFGLGSAGSLSPRVDWKYQSLVYFDAQNSPYAAQPGYGLWNASLNWSSPDETWRLGLQVLNAGDKVYNAGMLSQYSSFGVVDAVPGVPREYRVTLKRDFR